MIFGIGLSKTGTTSLSKALEILGYNSCHYYNPYLYINDMLTNPNYQWEWIKQFDAVSDIPIPFLYSQLDELFPNSKFILTVREPYDWLRSCEYQFNTVVPQNVGIRISNINSLDYLLDVHSLIRFCIYGSAIYDKDRFLHVYVNHIENVQNYFKDKDNLLIMNICNGDGWSKLCRFLNKKYPDEPFPHLGKNNELLG